MMCFRNTILKDIHGGIEPVSHTGDFSDVVVIDANGRRIPWPEVSRIGTFASGAVALGESLPMIGKLLGHTQVQTTARYAHLAANPVKAAAERVANNFAALMDGELAEVIPLGPKCTDRH